MRCSGSQITCIAPEIEAPEAARRLFEALLFEQILRPLNASLGPFGEIALGTAAERLFSPKT